MSHERLIRTLLKACLLAFFPLIIFLALFFSSFIEKYLKRALKQRGVEEVIHLLADKGLFGIFDMIQDK
jgi:hypothetical protein